MTAELDRARSSYAARAWQQAYDGYADADRITTLDLEDLDRYAISAHLLARFEDYFVLRERAYQESLELGDLRSAARHATWMGGQKLAFGQVGPASGWIARAARLVDEVGTESVELGWVHMSRSFEALMSGDMARAIELADQAVELGRRFGDDDLVSLTLHQKGLILLGIGQTADGFAAMDEAMVTLGGGDLSPMVTGIVYCGVISGCWNAYELRRAHDWTEAMAEWCDSQPELANFNGECKVRRAELKQLHGAWSEALDEVEQIQPSEGDFHSARLAAYARGNLARLQGRFGAGEEAYKEAAGLGLEPQPGLALVRLARGRTQAAATMVRRSLNEITHGGQRIELLFAAVEILLAVDAPDEAAAASAELDDIAATVGGSILQAMAAQARAQVSLHLERPEEALAPLRTSLGTWLEAQAPYQEARTRILLGAAYAALDDQESADRERETARSLLTTLGAVADLRDLGGPAGDDILTAREREVLALLATGATNKAIAGTLVLSERTVDRHVSNIFGKLGVTSRSAATAYAFERQLV